MGLSYAQGLGTTPLLGETDKPVTCHVTRGGTNPRYVCREYSHVARNAYRTDEVVFAHVMYVITHPRAYELLVPAAPEVDVVALRREKATIRATLERMAALPGVERAGGASYLPLGGIGWSASFDIAAS